MDKGLLQAQSQHLYMRAVCKLREDKAYSWHPGSLYRVFVRLGLRKKPESRKKKSRHLGKYDTPEKLGEKWQMDMKYVPNACYVGKDVENSKPLPNSR